MVRCHNICPGIATIKTTGTLEHLVDAVGPSASCDNKNEQKQATTRSLVRCKPKSRGGSFSLGQACYRRQQYGSHCDQYRFHSHQYVQNSLAHCDAWPHKVYHVATPIRCQITGWPHWNRKQSSLNLVVGNNASILIAVAPPPLPVFVSCTLY
jgi:hypothetical protein